MNVFIIICKCFWGSNNTISTQFGWHTLSFCNFSLSTRLVSAFTAFQHLCFGHGTHATIACSKRVLLLLFFFLADIRLFFVNSAPLYCSYVWQTSFFSNFFIKNESYSIIYTFKNYFITVFLVSVFNFSKNKLNPNRPK